MIFHAQPESDLAHLIYGLSEVNTAVLGEGLDTDIYGDERRFREKYKITILLIEHDMKLVSGICEYLTVLNFGTELVSGTPGEVLNDHRVITAYLGE